MSLHCSKIVSVACMVHLQVEWVGSLGIHNWSIWWDWKGIDISEGRV